MTAPAPMTSASEAPTRLEAQGGRSFRLRLALRIGTAFTAALLVAALAVHLALKRILFEALDRSLSSVASVQAGAIAESPADDMNLHEWTLTAAEAEAIRDINWLVEVWDAGAEPRLRTSHLRRDLPLDTAAFRRAQAGELIYRTQRWDDAQLRVLYYPIDRIDPRHAGHVLEVATSLAPVNETIRRIDLVLGALALLAVAGAAGGGWLLAGQALRPVVRITQQAEGIEAGSLDRRITAHARTAEFQGLVSVLNRMLNRLEAAFESQRRFIADASHELRSPIAAARGHLEVARRRERSRGEYEEAIDTALSEVKRLQSLAQDLLTLARRDAGVLRPQMRRTELSALIRQVAQEHETAARAKQIDIRVRAPAELWTFADPALLGRVVRNLVENAIRYTPSGREVVVGAGTDGGRAWLEVADTGPGIAAEALPHVFERFYRGDPARDRSGGAGLGLAIAQAIAHAHGTTITARNLAEGGAAFRLELDLA